ncbi:MAG: NAD(P)/FAD-dependent oxidoreductase [Phycisphaerales bacterium]|nr:NAD(P)/FAD-dependent oxidoreductase [Phycisphaerales bacterium]
MRDADVAIIGAGAAGLMCAIQLARRHPDLRVVLLDGARRPGAKILVAGGGRCNVTHHAVSPDDYSGSSRGSIRKVLGRFPVSATIDFFRQRGVELKREDTGKLFPTTDSARTILDALTGAVTDAGVDFRFPWRVERITASTDHFHLECDDGDGLKARRVVLATGGQALPRSGSDGKGYEFVRAMGHTVTRIFPALVPLIVPEPAFIRELSGLATPVDVRVHAGTGKRLHQHRGDLLCTHFGLSGPVILDVSRHLLAARHADAAAHLRLCWLPEETRESYDARVQRLGAASPLRDLRRDLPERLARALCAPLPEGGSLQASQLRREDRRLLVERVTDMSVEVTGTRGFTHAEVTAGGVPLTEVDLASMASRITPGLFLCGELCDVDGRIGGFNFQWAWASGNLAGTAAARALLYAGG